MFKVIDSLFLLNLVARNTPEWTPVVPLFAGLVYHSGGYTYKVVGFRSK